MFATGYFASDYFPGGHFAEFTASGVVTPPPPGSPPPLPFGPIYYGMDYINAMRGDVVRSTASLDADIELKISPADEYASRERTLEALIAIERAIIEGPWPPQ